MRGKTVNKRNEISKCHAHGQRDVQQVEVQEPALPWNPQVFAQVRQATIGWTCQALASGFLSQTCFSNQFKDELAEELSLTSHREWQRRLFWECYFSGTRCLVHRESVRKLPSAPPPPQWLSLVDLHRRGNLLSSVLHCCFSKALMLQGSLQGHSKDQMLHYSSLFLCFSTYIGQGCPRALWRTLNDISQNFCCTFFLYDLDREGCWAYQSHAPVMGTSSVTSQHWGNKLSIPQLHGSF